MKKYTVISNLQIWGSLIESDIEVSKCWANFLAEEYGKAILPKLISWKGGRGNDKRERAILKWVFFGELRHVNDGSHSFPRGRAGKIRKREREWGSNLLRDLLSEFSRWFSKKNGGNVHFLLREDNSHGKNWIEKGVKNAGNWLRWRRNREELHGTRNRLIACWLATSDLKWIVKGLIFTFTSELKRS